MEFGEAWAAPSASPSSATRTNGEGLLHAQYLLGTTLIRKCPPPFPSTTQIIFVSSVRGVPHHRTSVLNHATVG